MKKFLLMISAVLLLAVGCNQQTGVQQSKLVIESLNPVSGSVGTSIKIIGSGFTAKNNTINISNNSASASFGFDFGSYASADGKTLNLVIPAKNGGGDPGITIVPGVYKINIKNANGVSNSVSFTVIAVNAQQQTIPSPTNTSPPTSSPTTPDNSNTKTYTSNYGYQFTYSPHYTLDTSNPKKIGLRSKSNSTTDFYGNKTLADITIEYFSDLTQLPYYQSGINNIDAYVAQSGSSKSMYNITSYKNSNGVLVYSFTDAGLKPVYTELIHHNNHYYQISFTMRETGDLLSVEEKDVQKSFKFTK